MQVDREKEQTRTVGVGMAEQPPAVDLAQNVFYGHSGTNHVGRVVHRKNEVGDGILGVDGAKDGVAFAITRHLFPPLVPVHLVCHLVDYETRRRGDAGWPPFLTSWHLNADHPKDEETHTDAGQAEDEGIR